MGREVTGINGGMSLRDGTDASGRKGKVRAQCFAFAFCYWKCFPVDVIITTSTIICSNFYMFLLIN